MDDLTLTPEERQLVLDRRAMIDEKNRRAAMRLEIIKTAYEFEKWLQENGAGSTYSTFCDDFGYTGDNRQDIYPYVSDILNLVRDWLS